jgi:hypothetical protein
MQDKAKAGHHPLPRDERARHDLIPESVEDVRDKGEDSPGDAPSDTEAPEHDYRYPDGSPYRG